MEGRWCQKCGLDRWSMCKLSEAMVLDLDGEYVRHDDACRNMVAAARHIDLTAAKLAAAIGKVKAMEASPRWKIPIPVGFVYQCSGCNKVFVTRMNVTPNDGTADPYRPPECCGEIRHLSSCDPWRILERIGNGESFDQALEISVIKENTKCPISSSP